MTELQQLQEGKSLPTTRRSKNFVRIEEVRTSRNIADLVYLGRLHHNEFAPHLDYDEDRCYLLYADVKRDVERDRYNAYIAYDGDEPIGYMLCSASQMFFSKQISTRLEFWFVVPKYRKTRAAFELIRVYENWARLRGAIEIWVSVAHNTGHTAMVEQVSRMFEKMGYPKVGAYHCRTLIPVEINQ
jgi:GNAT superfamily N-acetyltransferase